VQKYHGNLELFQPIKNFAPAQHALDQPLAQVSPPSGHRGCGYPVEELSKNPKNESCHEQQTFASYQSHRRTA